jgi:hypothetical protein
MSRKSKEMTYLVKINIYAAGDMQGYNVANTTRDATSGKFFLIVILLS